MAFWVRHSGHQRPTEGNNNDSFIKFVLCIILISPSISGLRHSESHLIEDLSVGKNQTSFGNDEGKTGEKKLTENESRIGTREKELGTTSVTPSASKSGLGKTEYPPPKFVIPVHRILWKENHQLGPSGATDTITTESEYIDQKTDLAKKTVFERDVNFVEEVSGKPGEGYFITLSIGTPSQHLNVLLDTGSSNFAVAGPYENDVDTYFDRYKSSTLRDLFARVRLKYTQGEWEGDLVSDYVSFSSPSSLPSSRTPFTIITSSSKFFLRNARWQGILGLAYPTLSRPDRNQPSFVDLVVNENQLSNVFGLQLCGGRRYDANDKDSSAGHMAVGGIDSTSFEGEMFYTPIVREMYYEVVIADLDVGGKSLNIPCGVFNNKRTIVDSGTTNFLLPRSAFDALIGSLESWTASTFWHPIPRLFWERKQLICIRRGEIGFDLFPVIGVSLFNKENDAFRLELRPEQYLRAVSDYGSSGSCYKLSIGPSGKDGEDSGSILGAVLMEGFYVVFDKSAKRIGWAKNKCETSNSQAIKSGLAPPRPVGVNISECRSPTQYSYVGGYDTEQLLMVASYVLGGVVVFLLGIIIFLLVEPLLCRKKKTEENRKKKNQDYEELE